MRAQRTAVGPVAASRAFRGRSDHANVQGRLPARTRALIIGNSPVAVPAGIPPVRGGRLRHARSVHPRRARAYLRARRRPRRRAAHGAAAAHRQPDALGDRARRMVPTSTSSCSACTARRPCSRTATRSTTPSRSTTTSAGTCPCRPRADTLAYMQRVHDRLLERLRGRARERGRQLPLPVHRVPRGHARRGVHVDAPDARLSAAGVRGRPRPRAAVRCRGGRSARRRVRAGRGVPGRRTRRRAVRVRQREVVPSGGGTSVSHRTSAGDQCRVRGVRGRREATRAASTGPTPGGGGASRCGPNTPCTGSATAKAGGWSGNSTRRLHSPPIVPSCTSTGSKRAHGAGGRAGACPASTNGRWPRWASRPRAADASRRRSGVIRGAETPPTPRAPTSTAARYGVCRRRGAAGRRQRLRLPPDARQRVGVVRGCVLSLSRLHSGRLQGVLADAVRPHPCAARRGVDDPVAHGDRAVPELLRPGSPRCLRRVSGPARRTEQLRPPPTIDQRTGRPSSRPMDGVRGNDDPHGATRNAPYIIPAKAGMMPSTWPGLRQRRHSRRSGNDDSARLCPEGHSRHSRGLQPPRRRGGIHTAPAEHRCASRYSPGYTGGTNVWSVMGGRT